MAYDDSQLRNYDKHIDLSQQSTVSDDDCETDCDQERDGFGTEDKMPVADLESKLHATRNLEVIERNLKKKPWYWRLEAGVRKACPDLHHLGTNEVRYQDQTNYVTNFHLPYSFSLIWSYKIS